MASSKTCGGPHGAGPHMFSLSQYLSIYLPTCLSIYLSIDQSIYLSICLLIDPLFYSSPIQSNLIKWIYPSIYLSTITNLFIYTSATISGRVRCQSIPPHELLQLWCQDLPDHRALAAAPGRVVTCGTRRSLPDVGKTRGSRLQSSHGIVMAIKSKKTSPWRPLTRS